MALKTAHGSAGRASLFRDKSRGDRVQGVLTADGSKHFEKHRKALAKLAGRKTVSDADVIEYLARGEENTRAYLAQHA
jgi:hypothetical protein